MTKDFETWKSMGFDVAHHPGLAVSVVKLTLARNCCLLGRDRYWGDSVTQLFGFGLEAFDL